MIRTVLARSARCLATKSTATAVQSTFRIQTPAVQTRIVRPSTVLGAVRAYSAHAGLNQEEVQGRILDLLKNFDKVTDTSKLQPEAHFANDLGLDSLDTVEVVMAIEEEFSIEIPDKEADAIHSVKQAVDYILKQPDAH